MQTFKANTPFHVIHPRFEKDVGTTSAKKCDRPPTFFFQKKALLTILKSVGTKNEIFTIFQVYVHKRRAFSFATATKKRWTKRLGRFSYVHTVLFNFETV
jgi:hypothetical protein